MLPLSCDKDSLEEESSVLAFMHLTGFPHPRVLSSLVSSDGRRKVPISYPIK